MRYDVSSSLEEIMCKLSPNSKAGQSKSTVRSMLRRERKKPSARLEVNNLSDITPQSVSAWQISGTFNVWKPDVIGLSNSAGN